VIVDGCSSDDTLDLIRICEKKLGSKLHWISEKDDGIYDAMNKGISMSKGEWLYFMGSGDVLFDSNVLQVVNGNLQDELDVLYGNVQMGNKGVIYDGPFDSRKLILKNVSHQAIFFNRKLFKKIGFYNLKYPILADWEFNMRWMNNSEVKYKYINTLIAKFELGGASKINFDYNFYKDFENNIKKYFISEDFEFYNKYKRSEIAFVKNDFTWKLWELRNKMKFILKKQNAFIAKYIKK
jgi:glycosyltransferase involved in cell wall biosynthesis